MKYKKKQFSTKNKLQKTKKILLETVSLGSPRGIIFMILFGIIFMISITYFNVSSPFECIFKHYISPFLFGKEIECLGCGMTTALVHIFKFEFTEAFEQNKLVFLVIATVVYLFVSNIIKMYRKNKVN